jgi:Uma2 family endonuclease
MRTAQSDKIFTPEEYIQYELTSERRHEFINGQLFEMAGEKDINNEIAFAISVLLLNFLKARNYIIYSHDV